MNMEASICRQRDFLVLKSQNGVTTSTFAWGTWLYKADSIKEGVEVTFSGQMTPTGKKDLSRASQGIPSKFPHHRVHPSFPRKVRERLATRGMLAESPPPANLGGNSRMGKKYPPPSNSRLKLGYWLSPEHGNRTRPSFK